MATIPSIALIPSGVKLNEIYSVLPTNGDGDLLFTRETPATRVNSSGLIEEVATGIPRLDYTNGSCPSWLIEPQSTNLYLNSATLSTQNITTLASTYTVSFYGTGTITFSGTYIGSLVGTGVNNRVKLTFTATAGTLTSTISGTVTNGQAENLGYETSYILTLGSMQTRVAETASKTGLTNYINSQEGVFYFEIASLFNTANKRRISLSDGSINNRITFEYNSSANLIAFFVVLNGIIQSSLSYTLPNAQNFYKIALKWKLNDFAIKVEGIEVALNTSGSVPLFSSLNYLVFHSGNGAEPFYGKIKDLRVYKNASDYNSL